MVVLKVAEGAATCRRGKIINVLMILVCLYVDGVSIGLSGGGIRVMQEGYVLCRKTQKF
jgi:hypothetical protein